MRWHAILVALYEDRDEGWAQHCRWRLFYDRLLAWHAGPMARWRLLSERLLARRAGSGADAL